VPVVYEIKCDTIDKHKLLKNMTKTPKAMQRYSELNASDQALVRKLVGALQDNQLNSTNRQAVSRALIRAKRGANSASPTEKRKYANGYVMFYTERYPSTHKKNTGLGVAEVGKLLGAEWRNLDAVNKARYTQLAAESRK
jgi:hypothetical protein